MPTRREFMIIGAASVVSGVPVWGYGADSATLRYRDWLTQFQRDLEKLGASVADAADVTDAQVAAICGKSIVPDSRAAVMVAAWMKEAAAGADTRRGARRYAHTGAIVMHLLADSAPAGFGGLFQEPPGSPYPSGRFTVWYMHIGGPDHLQAYFDDKTQFPEYALPPSGTLQRQAYPFLLFEDAGSTLRLAGIGAEWMGAVTYLMRKQFAWMEKS